ncbi:PrgI family protein [Parafrankia discariae]|uniref:PrgI family protein n=1 Tax=Parafrankia discariae TaxID=365528 RepID=UPI000554C2E7|nr:PrgI family protein [Parafrankia discariae]
MPETSRSERVRIPSDVDRPDRILAGLTARQLTLLAPPVLLAVAVYWTASPYLPLPVVAVLVVPLLGGGAALALGQRGGLTADRYAAAALAHHRAPKLHLTAPEGIPAQPGWLPDIPAARRRHPVPARPLAGGVDAAGVIDLRGAVGVVAEVQGVNLALAGDSDTGRKVAGYARMLNALSGRIQITIRGVPVHLDPHTDRLRTLAEQAPHPALAAAARDHANFLGDIAASRRLRSRQILLTAYEPIPALRGGRDSAAAAAARRLEEALGLLAAAGLRGRILTGPELTGLLASAADPAGPPPPDRVTASGPVLGPARIGGRR